MSRENSEMAKAVDLKTPGLSQPDMKPQISLDVDFSVVGRFFSSSLFNEAYLRNDLRKRDEWDAVANPEFEMFLSRMRDLITENADDGRDSWTETETITNWIVPVMRALGWQGSGNTPTFMQETSFIVDEAGVNRTYRTDLLYVQDPAHKRYISEAQTQDKKLIEAREYTITVVEAKYWDRLEESNQGKSETKKRSDYGGSLDGTTGLGHEAQLVKYLQILSKNWGILTDGKTWKLLHKDHSADSNHRSHEFYLGNLIDFMNGEILDSEKNRYFEEAVKYFYFFFSKAALHAENGQELLIDEILRYSQKYINESKEELKLRFIDSIKLACNGFNRSVGETGESVELSTIRNISESHLFNVLFIRSCEMKGILPLKSTAYDRISLSKIIDLIDLSGFVPGRDELNLRSLQRVFAKTYFFSRGTFSWDGTELYEALIRLTKIIHSGTSAKGEDFGFKIEGFKESVFSSDEWGFAKIHKLTNKEMVEIIFRLCFASSTVKGKRHQQIPFNAFTARQLGEIYEGFLEFQLNKATTDIAYLKSGSTYQWKEANLKLEKFKDGEIPIARKGELFFSPDNSERKATGSFYTPDYIVQYIVNETLEPLVKNKSADEILGVKVSDPAMGSGHFLNYTLTFLTRAYLGALQTEQAVDELPSDAEAKRRVLEACIFGSDLNVRAVKLAKLGLWMESAYKGKKLEHLDDQLICCDALAGSDWSESFPKVIRDGGFHAIVGNPPYVNLANLPDQKYRDSLMSRFETAFNKVDLYSCFIERSLTQLRSNGRLGYIVSNSWQATQSFIKLRKFLLERFTIEQLVEASPDAFKDASVHTTAMVVTNKRAKATNKIDLYTENPRFHFEKLTHQLVYEDIQLTPGFTIGFNPVRLAPKGFVILGDICKFSLGIKTSDDAKFILDQKKDNSCYRMIRGKDIQSYNIEWNGKWIWYKPDLMKKRKGAGPRQISYFTGQKIVIKEIGTEIGAAIDANGYLCNDTVNVIYDFGHLNIHFLLGLLNSKWIAEWYEANFPTGLHIKINELKNIPIPSIETLRKNSKKVEKISELVSSLLEKKGADQGLQNKINGLVDSLYSEGAVEQVAA